MLQFDPTAQNIERTILIISDALGNTAHGLALAALGQFDADAARIVRLSKITSISQVEEHFAEFAYEPGKFAVIQTIASPALSKDVSIYLNTHDIPFIDALGPAISLVAGLTGMTPKGIPGVTHRVDERYFERIEAMEYFVEHDDGRGKHAVTARGVAARNIGKVGGHDLLAKQATHPTNGTNEGRTLRAPTLAAIVGPFDSRDKLLNHTCQDRHSGFRGNVLLGKDILIAIGFHAANELGSGNAVLAGKTLSRLSRITIGVKSDLCRRSAQNGMDFFGRFGDVGNESC